MQNNTRSAFKAAFIARTRELRDASKRSQEDIAISLGLPIETYKKYEKRSVMPLYLIDRFVAIVRGDLVYLITGRAPEPKRKSVSKKPITKEVE